MFSFDNIFKGESAFTFLVNILHKQTFIYRGDALISCVQTEADIHNVEVRGMNFYCHNVALHNLNSCRLPNDFPFFVSDSARPRCY